MGILCRGAHLIYFLNGDIIFYKKKKEKKKKAVIVVRHDLLEGKDYFFKSLID